MLKKILLVTLSFVALNSHAANPFTDCGIGAALFPNTHWAAVTSNVIWDAGTTALTSATASEDTCSGTSVETAQLIHDKYDLLETDIMLGSGSNLAALTESLQCDKAVGLPSSVSEDLANILSDSSYAESTRIEKSSKLYEALRANEQVQASCLTLS
jgi:hypothetical protein